MAVPSRDCLVWRSPDKACSASHREDVSFAGTRRMHNRSRYEPRLKTAAVRTRLAASTATVARATAAQEKPPVVGERALS